MRQYALPLGLAREATRIVTGPSLQPVLDRLAAPHLWPFGTAVLAGPPRSGKSLLARWFVAAGLGEAVDDAPALPEDAVFHRWNRAQADNRPLLLVSGEGWRPALPDLASRLGAAQLLEIAAPDDELLAGLVEDHAARAGLTLGPDAMTWLLPRMTRSHAEAEALVAAIDRLTLERKAGITISLLRDALHERQGRDGEFQPRLI